MTRPFPSGTEARPHITAQLRAFAAARFDRKRHLGLHLTAGLFTGIAAVWAFSKLLDAVLDNATLVRLDIATDARIHARVTPGGVAFFDAVSRLGSPTSMLLLGVVGGLVLVFQRRWTVLVAWTGAYVGGGIIELI